MSKLGTHAVKVKEPGDKVWYFLTPSGGLNRLKIYAATADPERCAEFVKRIVEGNPGTAAKVVELCPYKTPDWLRERNNDPYGTPGKHEFWATVRFEDVGQWRIFTRDGWWFGYKRTQNAWAHFRTEAEAREHAAGPQVDVWA